MSLLPIAFSRSSIVFCALAGIFLLITESPAQAVAEHRDVDRRTIGDFRRDLKTFMKLSKSQDAQTQRNAVFNLCALHHEVVSDSRFHTSQRIQGFRVVAANRLKGFVKEQSREFKEQNLEADTQSGDTIQAVDEHQAENEAIFQSALESYELLGHLSGGPAQVFDYAGGRMGGAPWDNGQQLVDLIQNTIDPAFWRDNGGSGAIHYYQPSRVLVISASQRIHDLTEDLLWKLRAAN